MIGSLKWAVAVIISIGALIGKIDFFQTLIIVVLNVFWYTLN